VHLLCRPQWLNAYYGAILRTRRSFERPAVARLSAVDVKRSILAKSIFRSTHAPFRYANFSRVSRRNFSALRSTSLQMLLLLNLAGCLLCVFDFVICSICVRGNADICSLLVENGAASKVDAITGVSSFHIACVYKHASCVEVLLRVSGFVTVSVCRKSSVARCRV
jgi:hypothetical protein